MFSDKGLKTSDPRSSFLIAQTCSSFPTFHVSLQLHILLSFNKSYGYILVLRIFFKVLIVFLYLNPFFYILQTIFLSRSRPTFKATLIITAFLNRLSLIFSVYDLCRLPSICHFRISVFTFGTSLLISFLCSSAVTKHVNFY